MNSSAEPFQQQNDTELDPGKPPPLAAKPAKLKAKPAADVPKSLSAMNLAMDPEEEAIAQRVEVALSADSQSSERNSAAGGVGHAVKERAHQSACKPQALLRHL